MQISGYMYKFQDLTTISGHFRTNFKISGTSGQRPGLHRISILVISLSQQQQLRSKTNCLSALCTAYENLHTA